jgi:hypothetical protein
VYITAWLVWVTEFLLRNTADVVGYICAYTINLKWLHIFPELMLLKPECYLNKSQYSFYTTQPTVRHFTNRLTTALEEYAGILQHTNTV